MVETWQQLSVLVVGCGSIGRRHARVLRSLEVGDIRACDPVESQRQVMLAEVPGVSLYAGYEAALADRPDTVLICTPPKLHVPMALQAIRAGCHVLCEKPLSDQPEGLEDLAAAADAAGRKVMVALCFRYHEGLVLAKQHLDTGRVGRLVSFRALMGEHLPEVRPDYRDLFSSHYLGAFDLSHEIDLAIWYSGAPIKEICALSGTFSDIGIQAPDVVELLMEFENRCLASVHLDFFQCPRRRQTELLCTQGTIVVEFARWDRCTVSVYEAATGAWEHTELITDRDDMFRAEDKDFLRAIAEDLPIVNGIREGTKSVEVVSRARQMSSSE